MISDELVIGVHNALHNGGGRVKQGKNKGLFREMSRGGYHFQTQNPMKNTPTGKMARHGHRITWIKQGGRYVGQVVDGYIKWF